LGQDLQDEYDSEYLPLREGCFLVGFWIRHLTQDTQLHYRRSGVSKTAGKEYSGRENIYQKPEAVIVVLFSRDGKISTRRKSDKNIGCDLIASKLGGGGHSYAAGFLISRKNNEAHDDNGSNVGVQTKDVVQALETVIE
jgi:nanoRNase/pAp phosphatase (c-di-AMP/oligoRNAs hydrolase)